MDIGQRIKSFRQKANISQEELAEKVGISRISMSNYERGERIPAVDVFACIANALNVSMDELFGTNTTQIVINELKYIGFNVVLTSQGLYNVIDVSNPDYKAGLEILRQAASNNKELEGRLKDMENGTKSVGFGLDFFVSESDLKKIFEQVHKSESIRSSLYTSYRSAFMRHDNEQFVSYAKFLKENPEELARFRWMNDPQNKGKSDKQQRAEFEELKKNRDSELYKKYFAPPKVDPFGNIP